MRKPLKLSWLAGLTALLMAFSPCARESSQEVLTMDGRRLEINISGQFSPKSRQDLITWISFTAEALSGVFGHWPRRHWQVDIAPVSAGSSDPIPWAQVHRGTVDRVEFFTLPRASSDELIRAWTGYHEMAHLLIPYRGWGDAWFSEGLASYYQNLLQVRVGVLSERQMWQKLHDGFERGRADSRFDGKQLSTVSDELRQEGGFMRVYWSGAWYFLKADTRLRSESGGQLSLDIALRQLNNCCADLQMSVPQIVRKLDELSGVDLFLPLYLEATGMTTMPEFESLFSDLDITLADGSVQLSDGSRAAQMRGQIVAEQTL